MTAIRESQSYLRQQDEHEEQLNSKIRGTNFRKNLPSPIHEEQHLGKSNNFQNIIEYAKQNIEHYDEEYNFAKISNQIKELEYLQKGQEATLKKMQKQLESRITNSQLIETIALINSGIHTDPNLIKLLKLKEATDEEIDEKDKLKITNFAFSKKLNQISESLTILMDYIKKIDHKAQVIELEIKGDLNEKTSYLQEEIDNLKNKNNEEIFIMNEKLELSLNEQNDKIRDLETKIGWKLAEFKTKMEDKVSEEKLVQSLERVEKQMNVSMKAYQIESSIDPERIINIERVISENRLSLENKMTECNFSINEIYKKISKELLQVDIFFEHKATIQKRFQLLNANFNDCYHRIKFCEQLEIQMDRDQKENKDISKLNTEEIKRINTILLNLKIGEDFQKMLEEMDPKKVLELQDTVDQVKLDQISIFKEIELAKREMDSLRAKSEISGILTPNISRTKFERQDISDIFETYLEENQLIKKIIKLESEHRELSKGNVKIQELDRKLARIQKQSDVHNVSYEMKGLQEQVKKEICLMSNKIKELELKSMVSGYQSKYILNHGASNPPNTANKVREGPEKRSISLKKLNAINAISLSKNNTSQESIGKSRINCLPSDKVKLIKQKQ